MKVRVGNMLYDSHKEPILIVLDEKDKKNITNMNEGDMQYCVAPSLYLKLDIKKFMDINNADNHSPIISDAELVTRAEIAKCLGSAVLLISKILHDKDIPKLAKDKYYPPFGYLKRKIRKW